MFCVSVNYFPQCTNKLDLVSIGIELNFYSWIAVNCPVPCAFIPLAVRRPTARSREVSKPRDPGLDFSNRSEI